MRNKVQKLAAAALAMALSMGLPAGTALAKGDLIRLGGNTRYDTMSQIADEAFVSSNYAIVATGQNFPDALAASALAGAKECPIILTAGDKLSTQARQRLRNLNVSYVYVIGGENAVSAETFESIKSLVSDAKRISGSTRIETSINVLKEVIRNDSDHSKTVIVANGKTYADALSISPYAFKFKTPILLANNAGSLSRDAIEAVKEGEFTKVIVLGGEKVVKFDKIKNDVQKSISDSTKWPEFVQISGTDRYATCNEIVEKIEVPAGMGYNGAAIATGRDYPDALTGSALCGKNNSVLMLTDNWTNANLNYIIENAFLLQKCYVLGGEKAISPAAFDSIAKAMVESKYFEATDSNNKIHRYKAVDVRLDMSAIKDQTSPDPFKLKPDSDPIVLYSSNDTIDVEYLTANEAGIDTYSKVSNVKTIHVSASGNDLLVSFNGQEAVKLTNYVSMGTGTDTTLLLRATNMVKASDKKGNEEEEKKPTENPTNITEYRNGEKVPEEKSATA